MLAKHQIINILRDNIKCNVAYLTTVHFYLFVILITQLLGQILMDVSEKKERKYATIIMKLRVTCISLQCLYPCVPHIFRLKL